MFPIASREPVLMAVGTSSRAPSHAPNPPNAPALLNCTWPLLPPGVPPPPPVPFAAAVRRPFPSTVMLALVYDPGLTAVLAKVAAALPGPDAVTSPVKPVRYAPGACLPLKRVQSVLRRHPSKVPDAT